MPSAVSIDALLDSKGTLYAFAAGAPPQTLLGKLAALIRHLAVFGVAASRQRRKRRERRGVWRR